MIRKLLFIVFSLGLVGSCVLLLEVTWLTALISIVFALLLFSVSHWYRRNKPGKSEKSSRSEPTSKRLLKDFYLIAGSVVVGALATFFPRTLDRLIEAGWPFLGAALFVLALSLYSLAIKAD